jgi:hypothetical protein
MLLDNVPIMVRKRSRGGQLIERLKIRDLQVIVVSAAGEQELQYQDAGHPKIKTHLN